MEDLENNSGEKLSISLEKGVNTADVTVRKGVAPTPLEIKPDIPVNLSGTIESPYEFLLKRIDTKQFDINRSHLIVDRDNIQIKLVINENDPYKRGTVEGKLELNPKFVEFGVNDSKKEWTPVELGVFFKMNRYFFVDNNVNMQLVSKLMNFDATITSKVKQSVSQKGDVTDNFEKTVNSNLPEKFKLKMPIFKGSDPETFEVETFAKINGRDVSFVLISPAVNTTVESIRDTILKEQVDKFKELAPKLAIIYA